MTLYSVCLIYTLSEFVESRWLSKVLLLPMWLANVENQLDARSSGLSIFWWAIFVLVGCIYILVGYLYFSGPSVFWWANFILLGCFI